MARAERRALQAVKTAKWMSFVYFLALVVGLGGDPDGLSLGVLLFWTLLAFAMQDRIEKGGVTKEHPSVALVQATIWPGLPVVADLSPSVVVGYAMVACAFVVAAIVLQHALHAAREDERTDAERRAHRRLGIGVAALAVVVVFLLPGDAVLRLVVAPIFLAFLGWSAAHGFYVGVTRALLFVAAGTLAIPAVGLLVAGLAKVSAALFAVAACALLAVLIGRPVPR